jgi:hypothetical protein
MNFNYLPPGGLLPLPPPDGLPVVLGPFGGAEPPFALLVVIMFILFIHRLFSLSRRAIDDSIPQGLSDIIFTRAVD